VSIKKPFKFKSSGMVLEEVNEATTKLNKKIIIQPIGIKTPIEFDTGDTSNTFKMHTKITKQVRDNLRNLLQTNWGEKLGFYNFGANLRELGMEMTTDSGTTTAMKRIEDACKRYMPYVQLSGFNTESVPQEPGTVKLGVSVTYTITGVAGGPFVTTVIITGG
jgi:phage baseplate assembly protein W